MSYCCNDKFKLQEVGDSFQLLQGGSVTSVNGKVGTVVLDAEDVGALPDTYEAPVTSVNTQTGDVVLDAGDIAYESTTIEDELGTINSALSSLSAVTEIIDTASGAIASFPDGSGLPMRSLLAQINPVQDLHGYDAPWAAGAGANQWDEQWEGGDISAETGINEGNAQMIRAVGYIPVDASKTYYFFCGSISSTNVRARFYDQNKTYIGYIPAGGTFVQVNESFTPPSGAYYMRFAMQPVYGTTYQNDIAVNYPATVTTYSPYANECPITGWAGLSGKRCGKNLLRVPYTDGASKTGSNVTYTVNSAGQITIACSASASGNFDYYLFGGAGSTYESTGLKTGTYTFSVSVPSATTGLQMFAFREDGTSLCGRNVGSGESQTFDIDSTKKYRMFIRVQNGNSVNTVASPQIEVGSTASTYEAYTSLPITCTWQTEAGTVYGGTVDVVTGVLTVTKVIFEIDGSGVNTKGGGSSSSINYVRTPTMPSATYNRNINADCCDQYPVVGEAVTDTTEVGIRFNPNGYIYIFNNAFTDLATAQTALNASPIHVVLTLTTPQTYQLTPQQISTLLGNNTVFVDTGSVSVTYQASIKGYIDKVLGA